MACIWGQYILTKQRLVLASAPYATPGELFINSISSGAYAPPNIIHQGHMPLMPHMPLSKEVILDLSFRGHTYNISYLKNSGGSYSENTIGAK